jgi:hypothetical protein
VPAAFIKLRKPNSLIRSLFAPVAFATAADGIKEDAMPAPIGSMVAYFSKSLLFILLFFNGVK